MDSVALGFEDIRSKWRVTIGMSLLTAVFANRESAFSMEAAAWQTNDTAETRLDELSKEHTNLSVPSRRKTPERLTDESRPPRLRLSLR